LSVDCAYNTGVQKWLCLNIMRPMRRKVVPR